MADGSYDRMKKQFDEMKRQTSDMLKQQQELEKGLGGYAKAWADIAEIQKDILHTQQQKKKAEEELGAYEAKIANKRKRWMKLAESGNKKIADAAKERLAAIEAELNVRKANVKILKDEGDTLEKNLDTTKKMVRESNKLKATFNSLKGAVKTWGWDKLKSWGVFEMDKAIRDSAKSMGVGNKQFQGFANNISKASETTIMMGSGIKNLAKMQGNYSKEIGRSVQLTEAGLIAMSEMAEGTGLGEEYAVGMAAGMDNFGASVEASRDLVQETVDIAGEMGVNSAKAAETLKSSLKLAQRFHFKGGVKGLAKMANEAARLKLDMDGIAGLAEQVFRPEGAVEMAAKLATMGGEFAKMADPMQMMFKARNDFEGFAKDIGKATSEFVEYNKETETFEIKGGLAADRMREIAKMTGISVEKLQEMAVQQKKIEKVGSIVPFDFGKDDKELIAGMAEMKDGEWRVDVGDFHSTVKDLQAGDLEKLRAEQQNLSERAEQSRTFQDVMGDIWETLQSMLLPVAQSLKENLGGPLQKLIKDWREKGFYTSIKKWVKGMADFVTSMAKPIINLMSALGPKGTLAAIIGGGVLFNAAKWIINGTMLGIGFNRVAGVGGVGGGGGGGISSLFSGGKGPKGKFGVKGGKIGPAMPAKPGAGGKPGMGGMGALGLGIGSMGLDYGRSMMEDPDGRMGKAMGVTSYAMTGAALGSMIPVVGTLIGGLAGAAYGAYKEFGGGDYSGMGDMDADISSLGSNAQMNDGIIKFNPRDKFTTVNDAVLASTSENQLNAAAKTLTNGGGDSKVKHEFDTVDININLKADGLDNELAKKLINNKEIIRNINTRIKEEASMVLSHGKLSPTPK